MVTVTSQITFALLTALLLCEDSISKGLPKCLNSSTSFSGLPAQLVRRILGCEPQQQEKFDWMSLRQLQSPNATCNDGSKAGYYIRRNVTSTNWVVFLEGGWYCYNEKTCRDRIAMSWRFSVTSSYKWSPKKNGDGILSPDKRVNPTWWSANHVYIPYCSSDVWTGNSTRTIYGRKFRFNGASILTETVRELLSNGLEGADRLLLTGSSAGGAGVMLNLDRIGDMVQRTAPQAEVRGLVDSGWFLDSAPQHSYDECIQTPSKCSLNHMAEATWFWNANLPTECTSNKTKSDHYKCFYGPTLYATVRRPVMLFNWLYDIAQIVNDNQGLMANPKQLVSPKYVKYIMQLGKNLIRSFKKANVRAVYAPSCIAHTSLTKRQWLRTRVNGKTLDDAIRCWYQDVNTMTSRVLTNASVVTTLGATPEKCSCHLIDECPMPQCNRGCPPIQDPMTGAEINLSSMMFGDSTQMTLPEDLPNAKLMLLRQMIGRLDKTPDL